VNGWTVAKYALTLAGIALVLAADRVGVRWLAHAGLGLIVVGFLLRFPQRRARQKQPPPADDRTS
jgi:hydrogenase/urease accessory protein HupE